MTTPTAARTITVFVAPYVTARFMQHFMPRLNRVAGPDFDPYDADELILTAAARLQDAAFATRIEDACDLIGSPFTGHNFGVSDIYDRDPDLLPGLKERVRALDESYGVAAASLAYVAGFLELEAMTDNRLRAFVASVFPPGA